MVLHVPKSPAQDALASPFQAVILVGYGFLGKIWLGAWTDVIFGGHAVFFKLNDAFHEIGG
jgi:hypothetical protein